MPPRVIATIAVASPRDTRVTAASQIARPWPPSACDPSSATGAPRRTFLGVADDRVQRFHGLDRMQTGGSLARQHDRVNAGIHGMGRVADLRPRGPGLGPHRLEHLRGHDHRDTERQGPSGDFLLDARHVLQRQLEPEIPTSHHDRVGLPENLLEIRHGFWSFELGDEPDVRSTHCLKPLARESHVRHTLHETQRHEIHAEANPELQIFGVLGCQTVRWEHHSGQVDALVLTQQASIDDDGVHTTCGGPLDSQLNSTVVQQQPVAAV